MVDRITDIGNQKSHINQVNSLGLPSSILNAIKNAAQRTGVDFSYLVNKASQESGFDPNAKASTSSATGLYQFTKQTWLTMIKKYGDQYGLSKYADHISVDSAGQAHVKDPTWKQAILNLRNDPQASALMAGELDKENSAALQDNVGGKIGSTELYLAHFLGAGGASEFLNNLRSNPKTKAADVLPNAASANNSVFYNADGSAKTLAQVYKHFAQKFDQVFSSDTLAASRVKPYVPSVNSISTNSTINTMPSSGATWMGRSTASLQQVQSSLLQASNSAQGSFLTLDIAQFLHLPESDEATRKRANNAYASTAS